MASRANPDGAVTALTSGASADSARAAEADGELVGLRTATSRTYRLKTGALQARLFDRPVDHRDGKGGWAKNYNRIVQDSADPDKARNAVVPRERGGRTAVF